MKYGNGFTVVEILVVMGLLGILLSAAVVAIDPVTQFKKGHDAKRKSDLRQIQSALELYRADQGYYPIAIYSAACPPSGTFTAPSGNPVYMQEVPCDPTNNTNYSYTRSPAGCTNTPPDFCNTYTISTCLEYTKDLEQDTVNSAACMALGRVNYTLKNP